jgi:hypothetical protein
MTSKQKNKKQPPFPMSTYAPAPLANGTLPPVSPAAARTPSRSLSGASRAHRAAACACQRSAGASRTPSRPDAGTGRRCRTRKSDIASKPPETPGAPAGGRRDRDGGSPAGVAEGAGDSSREKNM